MSKSQYAGKRDVNVVFEEAHKKGSEFGANWLYANIDIVQLLILYGFDQSDPYVRAIAGLAALATARVFSGQRKEVPPEYMKERSNETQ